ncbi:MAG: hypothetical protein GF317_12105 [Candidatus Lokiarchaeota archaeon]|nr:hypothetical protein [Candidatus Lokiarchaeota archaeon]MBD3200387.1 hypothetical protein [Candidatus Lokiarchaeota archaeon]
MKSLDKIFHNVLEDIRPTNEEIDLIRNIVSELKELLKKRAKTLNIRYTNIGPQGSTGIKQTHLKNDFDIDLFVGIPHELYNQKLNTISNTKLKKKLKNKFLKLCKNWIIKALTNEKYRNPRILYAEHPYVQVDYSDGKNEIQIDIVLYIDLSLDFIRKHGPLSAVDRTPWHGRFIKNNLTDEQKDQVRLLKQFFKASHSYGDKSPVGKIGFIGYSAELLIYHFKSLMNVFKSFYRLNQIAIDYFDRDLTNLRKVPHFHDDYLIIIDPIDKNRNVASAISEKSYKYCNFRIGELLENPSVNFFIIEEIPEFNIDSKVPILDNLFIVEFKDIDQDIHYTEKRDKLYSLGESIKIIGEKEFTHVKRFEKIIYEVYFNPELGEYNLALFTKKPQIQPYYERRGPPINKTKHAERFKEKNQNNFERDGFLWVKTKRNYSTFLEFLKNVISDKIPKSLELINASKSIDVSTSSGRKALYILVNYILPFSEIQDELVSLR